MNYDRASAIFNLVKILKNIVKIYSAVKSVKLLWFKDMFWILRRNYVDLGLELQCLLKVKQDLS